MEIVFGVIIGLLILMGLIVAHEFGHFIMARRNGVTVKEFGIGFPPRAIAWVRNPKWKKGDKTEKKWLRLPKSDWQKPQDTLVFSINWLPIGGFCSMDGESDADTRKGTFGASSFWAKTKILFGGVAMNWLVAAVVLTVLAFTGMPQFLPDQFYLHDDATEEVIGRGVVVKKVLEDSPAEKAGFMVDDAVVGVGDDGKTVSTAYEIISFGKEHPGETVKYIVERGDNAERIELSTTLNPEDAKYSLGIEMQEYGQAFVRSTWSAPIVGVGLTLQLTGETFKGLGDLVYNLVSGIARQFSFNAETREDGKQDLATVGDSVSGPVGIVGVMFPAFAQAGLPNLAFLAALISVSLACMNVLPIPALDGGRWLLIAIYKLRGKKLTKETEEKIVSRAFMVLLALIVIITVLDIIKISNL